jgi:redox-sensing transcriptional repressor
MYSRVLLELEDVRKTVSSEELARRLNIKPAQVRKDLAYFGQFGIPGTGYIVSDLRRNIKGILGTDKQMVVGLAGVGNLGSALLAYAGFRKQGFEIRAAFDNDIRKVGKQWEGVKIYAVEDIPRIVKEENIQMGIIAVPSEASENVAKLFFEGGVKGVLNFAPTYLGGSPDAVTHNVDLTVELETLSYFIKKLDISES